MRLRSWLSSIAKASTAYHVNPRAVVFGVACWLLWSGVREFSPPAARIVLGTVFLIGLFWPDRSKKAAP